MKKIKDWFQKLTPKQQRGVMVGIVMLVAIIIIAATYKAKTSNPDNIVIEEKAKKSIDLKLNEKDDDLALRISMKNQIDEAQKTKAEELAKQQSEINSLKDIVDALNNQNTAQQNSGQMQSYGDLKLNGVPPSLNSDTENADTPKAPLIINGGITVVSIAVPKKEAPASKDKEKGRLVNFIPAGSILKATLVNGMYAPTMGKGKESPYPALLQTWDLAFLPNSVRKDLAGCFVLGEAFGEMSDSRVHIRLSKISCISNDEKWVLQKPIKGFVNGDDGKVGIAGKIRDNFGRLTLGVLLAEFVSSAGNAVKAATQVQTYNPLGGITTSIGNTAQDIALSAAGSGIAGATSMLSKFYLDILKEMSPVIEVYGRRDVELILEDGIELLTSDYHWEGVLYDEKTDITDIDINFN